MKTIVIILLVLGLAGLAAARFGGLSAFLLFFAPAAWLFLAALALGAARLFLRLRPPVRRAVVILAAAASLLAVFRSLVHSPDSSPERRFSISDLTSLPYLSWVRGRGGPELRGAVVLDPSRAEEGFNLYAPRNLNAAFLVDREGEAVHSWSSDYFPGEGWHHVVLAPDGGLLVIVRDRGLLRLDRDSNLLWAKECRAHHDLAVSPEGDIFLLVYREELASWRGLPLPVVNDLIVRLSPEGELLEEISLYPLFADRVTAERAGLIYRDLLKPRRLRDFRRARRRSRPPLAGHLAYDVFHFNTLGLLEGDLPGVGRGGDFIVCSLMLDLVGTVERSGERVLWTWGPGELDKPHQPTVTPEGNILIFDNGFFRGWSRVIEVEPLTGEIVWEYTARPREDFFTATRGGSLRLPGGNTLITESNSGYVFEVTPEGEKVWEFYNPEVDLETSERSAIYRMTRISEWPPGQAAE